MMLYTVAIVLVHAVLAVQGNLLHRTHLANDTEALCADKPIALRTIHELEKLNRLVGDSKCSDHVKTAIADLLVLINETKDNICAQKSIDALRAFYAKYLDTSSKENKQREQLPKSLKKYALAFGMQMSSACKRRMVDVLANIQHTWQRGYEVEGHWNLHFGSRAIRGLVSNKSPVAEMLEGLTGPDEILLPGDLAPYIKDKADGANIGDDKMYVQTATAPYIRTLQEECNKNYAPIYKPLIKPIVQLTNMGFNYKDEPLRCTMECPKVSLELVQWTRVVFLCESLNNIHVIDVPSAADADEAAGKTIRVLTREEAKALEVEGLSEPEIKERNYKPVILHGVIFDKEDRKLKKAIRAFSTSKTEDERVAKRMLGKGISMFKTQIKRYNIGLLLSTGFKALVHRVKTGENLKVDVNSEIVKVLDGAIGHEREYFEESNRRPDDGAWEVAKDIAHGIGSVLSMAVMGILFIGFWVLLIGCIVLKSILLAHMLG